MRPSKKKSRVSDSGKDNSRVVKHLDSDSDDDFDIEEFNNQNAPQHHEFEDPFDDEDESEEEIIEEDGSDVDSDEEVGFASEELSRLSMQHGSIEKAIEALGGKIGPSDKDMDDDEEEEEADEEDFEDEEEQPSEINANVKIWRPDMSIKPNEKLQFSNSAYTMFYSLTVEWPSLSFDIIRDDLGYQRSLFPHTMYAAFGTQAGQEGQNRLQLLKMSDLYKTQYDSDEDSDVEDDENDEALDDDPVLESNFITLPAEVNRTRAMPQSKIVAMWLADATVQLYDLSSQYRQLNVGLDAANASRSAIHTITNHKTEGFALAWSSVKQGRLATGDCDGKIYLHDMERLEESFTWKSTKPYNSHTQSVEDLQFSPVEANVFASCSCDKTIRIWDYRQTKKSALNYVDVDVNVISWNPNYTYLLASGDDNGVLRIWDMRNLKDPVGQFTYHKKSITSVEWHPSDPSMLVVTSEDQTCIWDLSVERDEEQEQLERGHGLPPQLLFVHLGQTQVKEAHWHPQINNVIMTTALDGFNVFKPSNLE